MQPKVKLCESCNKEFTAKWLKYKGRYEAHCNECKVKKPWFRNYRFSYI